MKATVPLLCAAALPVLVVVGHQMPIGPDLAAAPPPTSSVLSAAGPTSLAPAPAEAAWHVVRARHFIVTGPVEEASCTS